MGRLECGLAQVQGRAAVERIHNFGYAVRSEMRAAAFGFDDAFGDKKHARSGFEGLDGGFEGEVGEEAKGHGDWSEGAGAVVVAEDWGWAAGVDVGQETEGQVVTTEKGGSQPGTCGGFVDCLIDFVRKAGEGVHHIDDFSGEELRGATAEDVLCRGSDGVGHVAGASDVGEEEDDVWAGCDCVEEIATGAS